MRIEEEGSLALDIAGERLHLITGAPKGDGTVTCHLLSEGTVTAYVIVLDLTGALHQAEVLAPAPTNPAPVLEALELVEPGTWRQGLASGLRRRLALVEQLASDALVADSVSQLLARTRAELEAVSCADANLRTALAELAPTWSGSLEALRAAAQRRLPS